MERVGLLGHNEQAQRDQRQLVLEGNPKIVMRRSCQSLVA
jgi:hypothetical protein